MIIPTILWGAVIGFVILIIWCIKRKKLFPVKTSLGLIISTIGICGGIVYCLAGILNYLHQHFNKIPVVEISNEEFFALMFISGAIIIIIGLEEFIRDWRKKR